MLRCANVLGANIVTPLSSALARPMAPKIAGFDPQLQFVEEDDVVRALCFGVEHRLAGVYNVAGDGRLPWSEILAIAGKRSFLLPPVLTGFAAGRLAQVRVADLPPELLDLLRFGRGVDNTKLKAAGFRYRYTTAGAIDHFGRRSDSGPRWARRSLATVTTATSRHSFATPRRWSGRIDPGAQVAVAPLGPLLGGDGVAHVVLPDPVDLEVAHGGALVAQAELLGHPVAGPLRGMIDACRRWRARSSKAKRHSTTNASGM